ncbi:MAG TPA: hypothetical protein PLN33_06065 [Hyphomonadaceae bacterium]|nr:hypothetical protein [Hyphomonadaceae bacterium]HPN04530.1 hypothetical protein [Hyphomonadaceae bacterium]
MNGGEEQTVRAVKRRSTFFLVAAALMTLFVFLGFLPSFYMRSQFRTEALPVYLTIHGLVMTAWQVLLLTQTVLIATKRAQLHRQLGFAGAGLAVVVVIVGVDATLKQPARLAEAGIVLPFPLEDLVIGNLFGFTFFAALVAIAIVQRRNAATHKRLLYWAGIVTIGPALTPARSLGEMIVPYFPMHFPPEIALGWVAWIGLLAHDWLSARSFHPATIVGGMMLLFVSPALLDWFLLIDGVRAWVGSLA